MGALKLEEDFVAISLDVIKRFKRPLMFDIHLKRSEKSYTNVFKKDDYIDWDRVKNYVEKGLTHFYVSSEDYSNYAIFVETLGNLLINPKGAMSDEESLDVIKELVTLTSYEIEQNTDVSNREVRNASNVVCACLDLVKKDQKNMFKLIALMAKHPYAAKHSVMVSLFTCMLAKLCDFSSPEKLKAIGLGAFLHDVGITQLGFDPEDIEVITSEQRKEINRHPGLGKQIVEGLKGVPVEVGQIILQHHEQPNGAGYPNFLKGSEIYPPAKMVAIADSFCALISKRSYRDAFSIEEAFKIMTKDEMKFDRSMLRKFMGIFGKES